VLILLFKRAYCASFALQTGIMCFFFSTIGNTVLILLFYKVQNVSFLPTSRLPWLWPYVISNFCLGADEVFVLLGCYAAEMCSALSTFQKKKIYISPIFKCPAVRHSVTAYPLKMEPICCPEMSVSNFQSTLRKSQKNEYLPTLRSWYSVVGFCWVYL
jgi:hypothetical protein